MYGRWAIVLAALCTVACRQDQAPRLDPFVGRTTVPPPATGSALPAQTDPYYRSAPSSTAPAWTPATPYAPPGGYSPAGPQTPPPTYTPGTTAPPGGYGYPGNYPSSPAAPPGGFPQNPGTRQSWHQPDQGPIAADTPAATSSASNIVLASASEPIDEPQTRFSSSGRPGVIRIVEPPPDQGVRTRDHMVSSDLQPPQDLRWRGNAGAPRAASSSEPTDHAADPAAVSAAGEATRADSARNNRAHAAAQPINVVSAEPAVYAFDRDYKWLQGRLEYGQVEGRWRLRYIAGGGPADELGGKIVLADSPLLEGFRSGDFVTVQGRLQRPQVNAAGFAPAYHVERIELQEGPP